MVADISGEPAEALIPKVEAAVKGDRNAAYQAMLAHPLGPKADKVQEVLDDLLETNRQYLPQFFR